MTSDQVRWTGAWSPTALVTVESSGERNVRRLPSGRFEQTPVGNRSLLDRWQLESNQLLITLQYGRRL